MAIPGQMETLKMYNILKAILIGGVVTLGLVSVTLLLVAAINLFHVYAVITTILFVILSSLAYIVKV